MNKRRLVKVQLFVLAGLAILLVSRVFRGLPVVDGEITIVEIDKGDLQHRAFKTTGPAVLDITAYGSFERGGETTGSEDLAAFPWIVRRSDRQVVWRLDPARSTSVDGTLIGVTDSLRVGAGVYDLYFATYGSDRSALKGGRLFGVSLRNHWTSDAKNWQVAVRRRGEAEGTLVELDSGLETVGPPNEELVFWTTGPLDGSRRVESVFTVSSPTPVHVYSIGELCETPCDYGWIEDVFTRQRVWELSHDNTVRAGGHETNKVFDGIVRLPAGAYRSVFVTDQGHAVDYWFGNPPYDPAGWGMTISAVDVDTRDRLQTFDVWSSRSPLVEITQVGDDERVERSFKLDRSLPIVVYAVGELRKGDRLFDYGWIEDESTGENVWKMSWGASSPAGGHSDNRLEETFMLLQPGSYILGYATDDSHSYERWRKDEPTYPERWGVSLFPFEANYDQEDTGALTLLDVREAKAPRARQGEYEVGDVVVDAVRLNNESRVKQPIVLSKRTRLFVEALGEIRGKEGFDYGWIVDDASGDVIWKMTGENTVAAGGDDRYRMFEGVVELDSGRYVVNFKTDMSHAYNDFHGTPPTNADRYGIIVKILPESAPENR